MMSVKKCLKNFGAINNLKDTSRKKYFQILLN